MKQTIYLLIVASMLPSCSNNAQSKAIKDQNRAMEVLNQEAHTGSVVATSGGYTMKAKSDGKDWTATSMMPPELTGKIIGYYKDESIALPYDRRYLVVGKKISFSENRAVDFFTNDEVTIWAGLKGEMEITKVESGWAEGRFFFTATSNDTHKTRAVTDGFFRIPVPKN